MRSESEMIEAKQATPHLQLMDELMDSRVPKTEIEHAAAREIEKLRAAIAEATINETETVEPVAWIDKEQGSISWMKGEYGPTWEPLYTHPPRRAWVGLTNDEREEIEHAAYLATISKGKLMGDYATELMRAIEAKLKEKNS